MLLGLQAGVIGALAWRMRDLQIVQNERYRLLAEENRINIRLIPPARGIITDRNGLVMAGNRQNYRVVMVREQAGDPEAILARLAEIIPLAPDVRERVLKEMNGRSAFVPVVVAEHLTWDDIVRVSANAPVLPGVIPEVGLSRTYPSGVSTAQVVGYVGPVSESDLAKLEDPDPLLQIPRFQIGKTGVEHRLEPLLRGAAGNQKIEVSAAGRVIRELGRVDGTPGKDIALTLDLGLQNYAMQRMAGESAAAAVIDVATGDIVALASSPGYDPNSFVFGIRSAEWKALLEDEYRPLANKTVTGTYPPGSTFKIAMALAALDAGVVSPGDGVGCPGFTTLGNRRFHCWKHGGHGRVDLRRSLSQSCDCYYYEMGRRLGPDRISAMARILGLGVKYDLPMPAVSEGNMPDAAWKKEKRGESWTTGDSFNYGIGQGFTLASPLQLAVMTARVASGTSVTPRLIRAIDGVAEPRRLARAAADRPAPSPRRPRGDVRGLERGHRLPLAHRRPGDADGRQDRHQPGPHHHRRRARRRRHQERAAAVAPPRPCALRLLRPLRQAEVRRLPDRRARRRRLGRRRPDRPRHPAPCPLRRPPAARGLSRRPAQGGGGDARQDAAPRRRCRPAGAGPGMRRAPVDRFAPRGRRPAHGCHGHFADLSVDKSARACLPPAGASPPRPPGRRARITSRRFCPSPLGFRAHALQPTNLREAMPRQGQVRVYPPARASGGSSVGPARGNACRARCGAAR